METKKNKKITKNIENYLKINKGAFILPMNHQIAG